jgi:hypothetical protein
MKRPLPVALGAFALCASAGLLLFGVLSWRATSIEHFDAAEATHRLDPIRQRLGGDGPMLRLRADGSVIGRKPLPNNRDTDLESIVVVTYDAIARRFTHTRIPFWFFRIKAPAAQYAFGGTGLDFRTLGLTAADLRGYGPALIVDHVTPAGGRLVVWTE